MSLSHEFRLPFRTVSCGGCGIFVWYGANSLIGLALALGELYVDVWMVYFVRDCVVHDTVQYVNGTLIRLWSERHIE